MGQIVATKLRNAVRFCDWGMLVVKYYAVSASVAVRMFFAYGSGANMS